MRRGRRWYLLRFHPWSLLFYRLFTHKSTTTANWLQFIKKKIIYDLSVTNSPELCSHDEMECSEDLTYINKVIAGDDAYYAFLVDKYKNMAYTISLKIIGDAQDAQDVVQESFIKAYQSIGTFKGNAKFSTWLYTIVYRTAILALKRKKNRAANSIDPHLDDEIPDGSISQFEQLSENEQSGYIKQAIATLPETEALLVTLYYLNESSVREIGEITGLSLPNIKIQLYRARKKLEQKLSFLLWDFYYWELLGHEER